MISANLCERALSHLMIIVTEPICGEDFKLSFLEKGRKRWTNIK